MPDVSQINRAIGELGLPVPIAVQYNRLARRIVLRVGPNGEAGLTVPPGVPVATVRRFLDRRRDWLEERCAAAPEPVPFEPGALVPIEGRERQLRHDARHRGRIAIGQDAVTVGGDARHMSRRVRDGLVALSRERLTEQVMPLARDLDRRVAGISVRDTRSRWGSCAANGRLSFSWRLILAPPEVLAYVGVHEVAHLRHHHHGPEFWDLVEDLMPDYRQPKDWLKHHGRGLHRYGAGPAEGADRMAGMH